MSQLMNRFPLPPPPLTLITRHYSPLFLPPGKQCPVLTAPEHGRIVPGTDSTLCGDSVVFECDPCYEIDGDNSVSKERD